MKAAIKALEQAFRDEAADSVKAGIDMHDCPAKYYASEHAILLERIASAFGRAADKMQ